MDSASILQLASLCLAIPSALLAWADYRTRRAALSATTTPALVAATAPATAYAPPKPVVVASGHAVLTRPRRLLSYLVDFYAVGLAFTIIAMILSGDPSASTGAYEAATLPALLLVVVGLAFWNSTVGRSPGKLLVGGRLVRFSKPTEAAGFLRSIGRLTLAVLVPFSIWFVFGAQRRAAHDLMTDTMVISTRVRTIPAPTIETHHPNHADDRASSGLA